MANCLLALGANLGNTQQTIADASAAIGQLPGTTVVAESSVHATAPIGGPAGQGDFANAAMVVDTLFEPGELLGELQAIETRFGRERDGRWSARTLDIDILLVDEQRIEGPDLQVPHPRMSYRPFVLDAAVEVAGSWRHPVLAASLAELHRHLHKGDNALVLYGGTPADRLWHAERIASEFAGWRIEPTASEVVLVRDGSEQSAAVKLAIQLQNAKETPRPGVPTLTIPAGGREDVVFDTMAAVECVWPDLCRRAEEG